uniref:Uncharacterized protein n=1 Tax=Vitis vinifera TaxID=29760 RepID=F6GW36_VITVI
MYNLGVPFSFLSHSLSLSFSLFSAILEKRTVALLVIWISTFLFPHSLLPTSLSFSPLSLFPHFSLVPCPKFKTLLLLPPDSAFFQSPSSWVRLHHNCRIWMLHFGVSRKILKGPSKLGLSMKLENCNGCVVLVSAFLYLRNDFSEMG